MTFQPAAGAHGEFTGLLLIKAYHESRGDEKRTKIIVPDSAHGTNPASAAMAGYKVVSIASAPDGGVDLEALQAACGEDTAGLMLTNPNTVGLFDKNILKITEIVHELRRSLLLRRSKPECSYGNCTPWRYGIRRDPPEPSQDILNTSWRRRSWKRTGWLQEHVAAVPAILQSGRKRRGSGNGESRAQHR